jgi:hypothetical protein
VEDSAAEVGELGTEAGERGREGGPVRGEVAVTPALVVVAAAQFTELELGRGSGARSRVRPLRRHRSGSRVCVHKQISDDGDRSVCCQSSLQILVEISTFLIKFIKTSEKITPII